jgi:signal transduction histidine kinase
MTLNSELIALLVHDLKNPLAALLSNLGFVASSIRDDEIVSEAVQDCLLSTEVLSRLIENIGTMGALEESKRALGEASIPTVLGAVERRMGRHAETSMFGLTTRFAPELGAVRCSSKLLELALDNIVATSMSYAPSGSTIEIDARPKGTTTASIAVLDDGAPVIEELRDQIGRKDAQGMLKSAKGGRYGRVFGLYIAALVAESCGGELVIGEREGRSCIELILPMLA